ncbi:MAG: DUF4276 family protein [Alphaproteobacteria bacterium]|jgi:hypothetical protein|nr:DUF4276 family protein [Alphaproteobacteria bacterium]
MAKEITLGISVEGQTEAYFAKYVLARYLKNFNINLADPLILGGNVNIPRIESVLSLMANNYDYVTTLYDFYGFEGQNFGETKESLCQRILTAAGLQNCKNIIPYIQMYEFEALLFSDLNILCKYMDDNPIVVQKYIEEFKANLGDLPPEKVNNSILTAPSKRIHAIFKRYKKSIYGYTIAQEIGVHKIREMCPNFNNWLENLINLAQERNQS